MSALYTALIESETRKSLARMVVDARAEIARLQVEAARLRDAISAAIADAPTSEPAPYIDPDFHDYIPDTMGRLEDAVIATEQWRVAKILRSALAGTSDPMAEARRKALEEAASVAEDAPFNWDNAAATQSRIVDAIRALITKEGK